MATKKYDWRKAHPEHMKKYRAKYRKEHIEKVRKYGREYVKKWRKTHRESVKNTALKINFNITLDEYNTRLEQQKGVCAACGKAETWVTRWGTVASLSVDHDHKTGKVRGLLCNGCNTAIGFIKEDIETLNKLVIYLLKSKEGN